MALHAPRGTADLLPQQAHAFDAVKQAAHEVFGRYGYGLVETPTFEQIDVFVRGIGTSTDVIGKEMFYTYAQESAGRIAARTPGDHSDSALSDKDICALELAAAHQELKADKVFALRPEQTAGVARAVVEHNLVPPGGATVKLWYAGSMFRHERPQKGRLREFHQIGAECLGAAEPTADAEVILMLMRFFEAAGIPRASMRLLLNSMGDDACRPAYRAQVRAFILAHAEGLCPECVRRADTNPLRAFDCKNPACQEVLAAAPAITDALCPDCGEHYAAVKGHLDAAGQSYEEAPRLVRGLDYYTRSVFEVQVVSGLGSQNAIGGGGRYDRLIEEFGGKPTPGLGFAVGIERILLALEAAGTADFAPPAPAVYVATVDADLRATAFSLAQALRDAGVSVELDHQNRSLKSQFKLADKTGAQLCVVVGPDEYANGQVVLRSMSTHEEQLIALDALVETVKETL
jgi:histidyl-tRNA synthetase